MVEFVLVIEGVFHVHLLYVFQFLFQLLAQLVLEVLQPEPLLDLLILIKLDIGAGADFVGRLQEIV